MIMMCPCIKIKEDLSIAYSGYELFLIKVRKFKDVIVQEEYFVLVTNTFSFDISSYVKAIDKFCTSFMKQVVKSPIRSNLKIINVADLRINVLQPFHIVFVDFRTVKHNLNLSLRVIYNGFKSPIRESRGI